jgi:hypothetical protein
MGPTNHIQVSIFWLWRGSLRHLSWINSAQMPIFLSTDTLKLLCITGKFWIREIITCCLSYRYALLSCKHYLQLQIYNTSLLDQIPAIATIMFIDTFTSLSHNLTAICPSVCRLSRPQVPNLFWPTAPFLKKKITHRPLFIKKNTGSRSWSQ